MTVSKIRGFTLIELMVVMAILSLIAVLTTPSISNDLNQKRAAVAVEETQLIIDAARSYRIANASWPGDATCSNAMAVLMSTTPPMLAGVGTDNKFNSPFSTSCTSMTFSVDQNALPDWDGYLANALPGTQVVNAATYLVRTTIGVPGSEPALDSKLSRVATGNAELNRMRTTLLLGGNDISEVSHLSSISGRFSGNLTVDQEALVKGPLTANGVSQFNNAATHNSTTTFNSTATFNNLVVLGNVVWENTGCPRNGAIGANNVGVTLSCQNGVWKTLGGGIGTPYTYYSSTGSPKSSSAIADTWMAGKACFVSRNYFQYGTRTDYPAGGCHVIHQGGTSFVLRSTAVDGGATYCEAMCIP